MNDQTIVMILGFIATAIAVVTPIVKLNANITTLTASINSLKEIVQELKSRIDNHGKEIDGMREKLADHEARIKALEK